MLSLLCNHYKITGCLFWLFCNSAVLFICSFKVLILLHIYPLDAPFREGNVVSLTMNQLPRWSAEGCNLVSF